jgi:hypothetical protein
MEMRSSVLKASKWLSPLVALSMLGCPKQELAPLGPCTVSAVSERVDQSGVSDVDLLFVIDNSGSMASEQLKLAEQLPKLVRVLTSGDRYAGVPESQIPAEDRDPKKRMFTPVKTMHLGVVSTNMGGIDGPTGSQEAILSCDGLGDDGVLQKSTDVAVNGVYAKASEFPGYPKDAEVLAPRPECDINGLQKYQEYDSTDPDDTPEATAEAFSCVSALGVRGCPFEQQLEAMWKALAPPSGLGDDDLYKFLNGTKGQGERANEGFLREEAILAVIIVSDEEDCSITDDGKALFGLDKAAEEEWGDLNLRCGRNAPNADLIHPTKRYIDGLKSLKPNNPDRIIYAAIVGVPQDAIESNQPIDDILERSDMQFAENTASPGLPRLSCVSNKGDEAYPPRRMLEVAKGFGDQAVIYSICEDDYGPALNTLIEKIASKLKGNCLPRQLSPGDNGLVNCQVFELLPKGVEKCDPGYGLSGNPISRNIVENGKTTSRLACPMKQLAVTGGQVANGNGWFYDNFSENLAMDCNPGEQQRIAFQFASGTDLPSGAGATFECFQPVARIDNDAKGFDAVNTRCANASDEPEDTICEDKNGTDGYSLQCIPATLTCQIKCANNPDCPPGWVCAKAGGGSEGPLYCQLPTCPQDNAVSQ